MSEEPTDIAVEQTSSAANTTVEAATKTEPTTTANGAAAPTENASETTAGLAEAAATPAEEAAEGNGADSEPATTESAATEPPAAAESAAVEPAAVEPVAVAADAPMSKRQKLLSILLENFRQKNSVEGTVIGWNQGGFHISLEGIGAFCPRSQIEIRNPRKPAIYMDHDFSFRILEMDDAGRRIVVSRSEHLTHERAEAKQELRKKLQPEAILEGRVDSLSDFGAFVDLGGGIRGLVHVSELGHGRVERADEVVQVGQVVKVKVLKIEKDGKRISLSMRALAPDPWEGIEERLSRGSEFTGKVVRHTDFGIFVEIEGGVEGLLHSSQLAIGASMSDGALAAGSQIQGWIREVDRDRGRLSLTMREVPTGDPWEGIKSRYEEGSVVEGQVEQSSRFGFFVALEPGLTGLLPFSAVTAPGGRRREDAYRAGQKISVRIMDIDAKKRRLSLGLESARAEGSKADLRAYKSQQRSEDGGLNAMAAAFEKMRRQ